MTTKPTTQRNLRKPGADRTRAAAEFAEGAAKAKIPSKGRDAPAGDVRLTVNVRAELHRKLKGICAAQGVTAGELIEQWIEAQPTPKF